MILDEKCEALKKKIKNHVWYLCLKILIEEVDDPNYFFFDRFLIIFPGILIVWLNLSGKIFYFIFFIFYVDILRWIHFDVIIDGIFYD